MGSGSVPHADPCVYRSIRITGRMITVADPGLDAINLDFRPVRSSGRKLMTVPILLSPAPLPARCRNSVPARFERRKVNGPLTGPL